MPCNTDQADGVSDVHRGLLRAEKDSEGLSLGGALGESLGRLLTGRVLAALAAVLTRARLLSPREQVCLTRRALAQLGRSSWCYTVVSGQPEGAGAGLVPIRYARVRMRIGQSLVRRSCAQRIELAAEAHMHP